MWIIWMSFQVLTLAIGATESCPSQATRTNNVAIAAKEILSVCGRVTASKLTAPTDSTFRLPVSPDNENCIHSKQVVFQGHMALDFPGRLGSCVQASRSGKVIAAKTCGRSQGHLCNGGLGYYIEIEHEDGMKTLYAHLDQDHRECLRVKEGDFVPAGKIIGCIGRTGAVRIGPGYHLHFEILSKKNDFFTKMDPRKYLNPELLNVPREVNPSCAPKLEQKNICLQD